MHFRTLVSRIALSVAALGLLLATAAAPAHAVSYGPAGPSTPLDSYRLFGCWRFLGFEHAFNRLSDSPNFPFLARLDGEVAVDQFFHAYKYGNADLTDQYLYSYSYDIVKNQYERGLPLNAGEVAWMDSECGFLRSITGTWSNYSLEGVRWSICDSAQVTLDGDANMSSSVDLGEMAWELGSMTGLDVRYTPGLGPNAGIWVHRAGNLGGAEAGVTNYSYDYLSHLVHSDVAVASISSGHQVSGALLLAVTRHELGHAIGLGHAGHEGEVMYGVVHFSPTAFSYQSGDFYGGMNVGTNLGC